jgi:hypothetical protein
MVVGASIKAEIFKKHDLLLIFRSDLGLFPVVVNASMVRGACSFGGINRP